MTSQKKMGPDETEAEEDTFFEHVGYACFSFIH